MRVMFQPYFGQYQVRLYDTVSGGTIETLNMKAVHAGAQAQPNSLASYSDPSTGIDYLFVSCIDTDNTNHVDIYNMADALTGGSPPPVQRLTFPNGVVGLALQPGTGDLYIATFADADSSGGVFYARRAPAAGGQPYATVTNFANYGADASVAKYSANLAFDPHGNLWMTTFDEGGQYLICFTNVPADKTRFYKLVNGNPIKATGLNGSTPPAAGMLPLSQPEGLAFDPWGNLWLANNADDFPTNGSGNGALLNLAGNWLAALRALADDGSPRSFDSINNADGAALYFLQAAKFGGLAFDGPDLYANDQEKGVVWKGTLAAASPLISTTAFASTSLVASGIPTTYPGNGQMVLVDTAPARLLIRDWSGDTGAEPSPPGQVPWESIDISLFVDFPQDPVALLTVTVKNIGTIPTSGKEMLRTYWAVASSGLYWPSPWDGFTPGQVGGPITTQQLGVIAAGASQSFTLQCLPGLNLAPYSPGLHFCILARIEATPLTPFGMDTPETTPAGGDVNLGANVENNRGIGWHNVSYPPPNTPGAMVVRAGNYSRTDEVVILKMEILDHTGHVASVPGVLAVTTDAAHVQRLQALASDNLRSIENNQWRVYDLAQGIRDIKLAANESLPLDFTFAPTIKTGNYVVRFIQTVERNGKSHVIGGQTFVIGTVNGFPRPKKPEIRPAR